MNDWDAGSGGLGAQAEQAAQETDTDTETNTDDEAQGAGTTQMSLEELISAAKDAGDQKLESISKRGEGPAKKAKDEGPRKPTTAEAFASALELIGEGTFVTVKSVTAIMEHQGWTSTSRSEREKYVAVKSAIYNRKRAGDENPKMALPIDWSKSREGLFAYKPIVNEDEAEAAEQGDPTPDSAEGIPTE